MDSLGNLLNKKLQFRTTLVKQVTASLVVEFANEKIKEFWGQKASEQGKAVSLSKAVLTINCTNSVMAQELKFKHNKLINEINNKFGVNTVKKLKIVQKGVELPVIWC